MIKPESCGGALKTARSGVERVCALLVTPDPATLDSTAVLLERAATDISEWRASAGNAGAAELQEIRSIREMSARAGRLLQKAFLYHQQWNICIGSRTGGYRAGGQAAAVVRPGSIRLEA